MLHAGDTPLQRLIDYFPFIKLLDIIHFLLPHKIESLLLPQMLPATFRKQNTSHLLYVHLLPMLKSLEKRAPTFDITTRNFNLPLLHVSSLPF